eukprot:gene5611-5849_t
MTARVFYNRCAGPLPSNAQLQLKAGLNKWEEIVVFDAARCAALASAGSGQEWWEVTFEVPAALFKLDFVMMDKNTGAVDNNKAKDFSLKLVGGPTEQQLLEQRAEEYAAAEATRRALLAAAEVTLWEKVQMEAAEVAAEARVEFRERRTKELMAAAAQAVAQRRRPALATLETALSKAGVFAWVGGPLKAGCSAKLHLGYDGWYNKEKQYKLKTSDASWCGAWVDIPASAAVVDFVISDKEGRNWDNNSNKDFHSSVEAAATSDSMVEMVFQAMKREAAEADSAAEDRAASRAMRRVESKAQVLKRRREAQHEFLYTLPVQASAGQAIELFYNPDLTPLRGRPEIYVRGAFNRWRHNVTIPPTKMTTTTPGGVGFLKATIDGCLSLAVTQASMARMWGVAAGWQLGEEPAGLLQDFSDPIGSYDAVGPIWNEVPEDAHMLDVVFADGPGAQAGFFDNNGGLDYHIPIEGGTGTMPGLKVVHIAVEMAPIAKVGGMGDVVTALARAVQDEGNTVEVIIPKYDIISYHQIWSHPRGGGRAKGSTMPHFPGLDVPAVVPVGQ